MLLFRMPAFACQGPERNKYRLPTGTKSGLSSGKDKSAFREREAGRSDGCGWAGGDTMPVRAVAQVGFPSRVNYGSPFTP